jgi:hypothetical protein
LTAFTDLPDSYIEKDSAMLVTFYLPCISLLECDDIPASVTEPVQGANVQSAILNLQRHLQTIEEVPFGLLQLQGDLQLSIGMEIDADESYRDAQKRCPDKDLIRFTSCRNAGWQALFRGRYGTAMSCFMDVVLHGGRRSFECRPGAAP